MADYYRQNALPPGLRGYVAAELLGQREQAHKLGMLGQLANMQGAAEDRALRQQMAPLQFEQLQMAIDAKRSELAQAQAQREAILQFTQTLPESDRPLFLANPTEYLKNQSRKYTVGNSLVTGAGTPVFTAPEKPTLTEVGVTGQPGVTQRAWATPGSPDVTPVGAPKLPEILNPDVRAAKKDVAAAGATRVNVPVSLSTEKKYGEQFAGLMAKSDVDLRDSATKAPELAERSLRIRELLRNPSITGTAADFRLQIGKAAQLAGLNFAEDAVVNTEVLSTELAKNTLDAIKASGLGSGTGFSNADRDFLEKAVGGKITLERQTIDRLATLAHRAAVKTTERWNARVKQIPPSALEGTGVPTAPIEVRPLPETSQQQGSFPAPSRAAISRLQNRPSERAQFEAVFGPGSADQYLK